MLRTDTPARLPHVQFLGTEYKRKYVLPHMHQHAADVCMQRCNAAAVMLPDVHITRPITYLFVYSHTCRQLSLMHVWNISVPAWQ